MEPFLQLMAHFRQVPRKEVVCFTDHDKLLGSRRPRNQSFQSIHRGELVVIPATKQLRFRTLSQELVPVRTVIRLHRRA